MSDLIEAVARALCREDCLDPDGLAFDQRFYPGSQTRRWELFTDKAHAAIAAIDALARKQGWFPDRLQDELYMAAAPEREGKER